MLMDARLMLHRRKLHFQVFGPQFQLLFSELYRWEGAVLMFLQTYSLKKQTEETTRYKDVLRCLAKDTTGFVIQVTFWHCRRFAEIRAKSRGQKRQSL